jgi:hypothetical protein
MNGHASVWIDPFAMEVLARQSPLKITPLLVRRGCRARQLRAGWATPLVFLGATDYFTEYLRMTRVICLHLLPQ